MKKILSTIITLAMVLSCSSFAAPVTVATVETALESGETLSPGEGVMEVFGEEVATEHGRYGYLAYNIDFDIATTKTSGNYTDFTTNAAVSEKIASLIPAKLTVAADGCTVGAGTDGKAGRERLRGRAGPLYRPPTDQQGKVCCGQGGYHPERGQPAPVGSHPEGSRQAGHPAGHLAGG